MKKETKITQAQIDHAVEAIIRGFKPKKIILFGSFARGDASQDSDIDLLVIKDDNLAKVQRNRLARSYIKDLLYPVDIIVKTSNEFEMLKEIIGTVVYDADKYGKILYDC